MDPKVNSGVVKVDVYDTEEFELHRLWGGKVDFCLMFCYLWVVVREKDNNDRGKMVGGSVIMNLIKGIIQDTLWSGWFKPWYNFSYTEMRY